MSKKIGFSGIGKRRMSVWLDIMLKNYLVNYLILTMIWVGIIFPFQTDVVWLQWIFGGIFFLGLLLGTIVIR